MFVCLFSSGSYPAAGKHGINGVTLLPALPHDSSPAPARRSTRGPGPKPPRRTPNHNARQAQDRQRPPGIVALRRAPQPAGSPEPRPSIPPLASQAAVPAGAQPQQPGAGGRTAERRTASRTTRWEPPTSTAAILRPGLPGAGRSHTRPSTPRAGARLLPRCHGRPRAPARRALEREGPQRCGRSVVPWQATAGLAAAGGGGRAVAAARGACAWPGCGAGLSLRFGRYL